MDEYIKAMENYSPVSGVTGQEMDEEKVINMTEMPKTTSLRNEDLPKDAPYMAPKMIEVKRYTLKK